MKIGRLKEFTWLSEPLNLEHPLIDSLLQLELVKSVLGTKERSSHRAIGRETN